MVPLFLIKMRDNSKHSCGKSPDPRKHADADELRRLGIDDNNVDAAFAELVGEIQRSHRHSTLWIGGALGVAVGIGIGVLLLARRRSS